MPKVRLRTGESSRPVNRGLGTRRVTPDRGRGAAGEGAAGAGDPESVAPDGAGLASSTAISGAVGCSLIGRLRPLLQSGPAGRHGAHCGLRNQLPFAKIKSRIDASTGG